MSTYDTILMIIQNRFNYSDHITPNRIYGMLPNGCNSNDFLNSFKLLEKNGIIRKLKTNYTYMSDWSVEYVRRSTVNPIQPSEKIKEQTEKTAILASLNDLANNIGKIYSLVEHLQTPNDFDVKKISTDDLMLELNRRLKIN